jgi:hypothetical protein
VGFDMSCVWLLLLLLLLLLLACSGLSIPSPSGTSPVPYTNGTHDLLKAKTLCHTSTLGCSDVLCVAAATAAAVLCSGLSIPTPSGTSPVPDTIGTQVYSTEITTEVRRQQQQQQQQQQY